MSSEAELEGTEPKKEENGAETNVEETGEDDEEIEALKRKVREMEEEDAKLRKMQDELESSNDVSANKEEVDARSIYIGGVDYSVTPEELQQHFHSCGTINRVTILCDKWTGHPKGFAYVEFADKDSVANAMLLNETLLKGRQLKVLAKRTNVPGMVERGRGRGFHRGGGYYGGGGYRPYFAPRGRFRGRRPYYHPY